MSLEDFWMNVLRAATGFPERADVRDPELTEEALKESLRKSDSWFRKRSVARFDPGDFDFLPGDRRVELSKWVGDFERLAPYAPAKSASPGDKETALDLFAGIVMTMEFARFFDAEGLRFGKLIERQLDPCPPEGVADFRFGTDLDHSGDPALRILVFIDRENSSTDEKFLKKVREVEKIIGPIAREIVPERWPYFRFLSIDEEEMVRRDYVADAMAGAGS